MTSSRARGPPGLPRLLVLLVLAATSLCAVPSRPRNLQAVPLGPHQIQLGWEPPDGHDGPANRILEYVLTYWNAERRQKLFKRLQGDKKSYLMDDLIPDTMYSIELTARTQEGKGVAASVMQRTAVYGE